MGNEETIYDINGEKTEGRTRLHVVKTDQADEQTEADLLNQSIERLCEMKAKELMLLGYEDIQPKDIWLCVRDKMKNEDWPLHRIVNEILSLKPTRFMNWLTMQVYKS